MNSDKLHLNENGKLIVSLKQPRHQKFLLEYRKNLKIPEYQKLNPNFENIKDPVFKAVLKYKNHLSITVKNVL